MEGAKDGPLRNRRMESNVEARREEGRNTRMPGHRAHDEGLRAFEEDSKDQESLQRTGQTNHDDPHSSEQCDDGLRHAKTGEDTSKSAPTKEAFKDKDTKGTEERDSEPGGEARPRALQLKSKRKRGLMISQRD
jgi:hypothetical protein